MVYWSLKENPLCQKRVQDKSLKKKERFGGINAKEAQVPRGETDQPNDAI